MRDQNRPKQDLINEVVGLRKQVADLKQAAVARWRAEEAVRRSEEQYRALVEYVPGGICRLSPAGEFVQVNAAFAEMLGYGSRTGAVDIGREGGVFAGSGERERVLAAFRGSESVQALPAELRRSDGSTLPVKLSGRAVRDAAGQVECFAILVTAACG